MTCYCVRDEGGICYAHDEPPDPIFEYVDDQYRGFRAMTIATIVCFVVVLTLWVALLFTWVLQ